jgi:hypothetical protein
MRQKSRLAKEPAEQVVKEIRRATRRQFSAEDKIRIVLEDLRGEDSIAELPKATLNQNLAQRGILFVNMTKCDRLFRRKHLCPMDQSGSRSR